MIKKLFLSLFLSGAVFLSACNNQEEIQPEDTMIPEEDAEEALADVLSPSDKSIAVAPMQNTEGEHIGNVHFLEKNKAVFVEAFFEKGIPKGFHGFHIHETGICDPNAEDGPFTSAGGHYNRDHSVHGAHTGDMPSLYGLDDGSAYLITALDGFHPEQLINEGRAIIVHSGADNFANIPDRYTSELSGQKGPDEETLDAGDAGSRIACGMIKKAEN